MKFDLNQKVIINIAKTEAEVVGRSEYTDGHPQYLLRYVTAQGTPEQQWWPENALSSAQ